MGAEAIRIKQNEEATPRMRVSLLEIAAVKRQHILDNLCYTPDEAGAIFSKSNRWALERVKDGKLTAVDENARYAERGGKMALEASTGIRITAESVERFRKEYEIAPEKWSE